MTELLNAITQGDAIENMRKLADDSVDLIVIDPPYNIGKDKRWDKWKTVDAYVGFMGEVFTECERVLKPTGSFYWFHNDIEQIAPLIEWLRENTELIYKQFIVWNKRFDTASNKGFLDGFVEVGGLRNYQKMAEYCLYYVAPDTSGWGDTGWDKVRLDVNNFSTLREYFSDIQKYIGLPKKTIVEVIGQRADHCLRSNSTQWSLPTPETYADMTTVFKLNNFERYRSYESLKQEFEQLRIEYEELRIELEEKRYTFNNQRTHHSVWNYEVAPKQGHITPKPTDLIENIIRHSSNEGDIVLDCFGGSGTTAVAALNTGRNYVLIEREPEYCEIARKRVADALQAK